MRDLLNQLRKTKMILTGLILVILGIALLIIGGAISGESPSSSPIELIPWTELGGILVGGGILGIWIDHLFKREQEAATEHQLRSVLTDHAPIMRDAVLQAFAADQEDLARIATPQTLDQIITNSLGLRLGDNAFAQEIYADLKQQTVDVEERWEDASVSINVVPHETVDGYFIVISRWEYTVTPKHLIRRFICLGDRAEYMEIARSHNADSAWYKPDDKFSARDEEAFKLLSFTVDGVERPIRRSTRNAYQAYSVSVGAETVEASEPVTITYTTRTITKAEGHLLYYEIEQPTNGVSISFDYASTDIATLSAVDLIQSLRPTRVEHSPAGIQPKTLRVEIDGWIFPRSGVAFVWTLDHEHDSHTAAPASKLSSR